MAGRRAATAEDGHPSMLAKLTRRDSEKETAAAFCPAKHPRSVKGLTPTNSSPI